MGKIYPETNSEQNGHFGKRLKKKSTRQNGPSMRNENILLPVHLSNSEGKTYSQVGVR